MSAVLNGKIIFEANPPDGRIGAGTRMAAVGGDVVNSDPHRHITILFCTSVVTGAP
jgi:hypothetical protein